MSIYDNGFNNLLVKDPLLNDTTQSTTEKTSSNSLTSGELTGNLTMADGYMQSGNFVTGSAGWKIDKDGNVEFNDGTFRGDLVAGTIAIGTNGWHVDSSGNMWWGSSTTYAGATIKISSSGSVDFTTGNFSGTLNAPSGTLGTVTGGVLQTAATGYRIKINGTSGAIEFLNGDTVLTSMHTDSSANLVLESSGQIKFYFGASTTTWFMDSTGIYPNTDKKGNLGSSSKEWAKVYSQEYYSGSSKGTTQTWDFDAGESHRFVFVSGLFISHTKL